MKSIIVKLSLIGLLAVLVGCANRGEETAATAVVPTPTVMPTPVSAETNAIRDFIVVATDAPNAPFAVFNQFGEVDGFDSGVLAQIAAEADLDYEFVVTPFDGVLENIANFPNRDFDAFIAKLEIPDTPQEGIVYTDPYLEVGQVLVVLADDRTIQSYQDLGPGMRVGVVENSPAEMLIGTIVSDEIDLQNQYETSVQALQALVDEMLTAVIIDSHAAEYFTQIYPEQIKIVGGDGSWISSTAYGIALSEQDDALRLRLNQAIATVREAGDIERLVQTWLIPEDTLIAGQPRVGPPATELVIGILGQLQDMDPAALSDLIGWEIKNNTMSGLYMYNSNNELIPILAAGPPAISEDKLEYTIPIKQGLRFPDESELTADDVKWSIDRSRSLGNFLVNTILKDSDGDNFADDDAVQVIDQYTVKLVLQEPTGYFLSLLATPPYFPISDECFAATWDLQTTCGGIGPYTIVTWTPDDVMKLRANPEWPGQPAPAFENITLDFYDNSTAMRRALEEFHSIDIAWTGLPYTDFVELVSTDADDGQRDFTAWMGGASFKSYIIFDQDVAPWDKARIRQAAALAIDRDELAETVFNNGRRPLLSPVPDQVPGHIPVLPARDLAQAQALLGAEGFSETNPLAIELWYVSDGRYSDVEDLYANTIKAQLEETNIFQVTLSSAPFEVFRAQIAECNYPAYLLGWPSPGRPTDYLDVMAWTEFFVTSNSFCSNYESEAMTAFVTAAQEEVDPAARQEILAEMQRLWAEELPTLDLLQEPRVAISLTNVNNVRIDALGLLHYEVLSKGEGE